MTQANTSPDFIATYNDALSSDQCKQWIKKFERSREKAPGMTGNGVNLQAKNSQDITISTTPNWQDENAEIEAVTYRHLVKYVRSYPHLLTGAVSMFIPDPQTGQQMPITPEIVAILDDPTVLKLVKQIYTLGTINLQKYDRKVGGYHHFHSENYPSPNDSSQSSLHRVLLFMYYLNDVREGGETEFYYQQRKLSPKKGQLVFAPSGFSHTHKGHVPTSNDKYILTSWVLFKPAEVIYGQN